MASPESKTKDGFELQFGTNHLGHFLLFQLLKPALLASTTPDFNSRVVSVASTGHRVSTVLLDDLDFAKSGYNPWKAYGQVGHVACCWWLHVTGSLGAERGVWG